MREANSRAGGPVHAYFQTLNTCFLTGDRSVFDRFLSRPLVIYSDGGFAVLSSFQEQDEWLRIYQTSLLACGVAKIGTSVTEHVRSSAKMSSYVIQQRYLDRQGARIRTDKIRYFVRREERPTIEMIERLEGDLRI